MELSPTGNKMSGHAAFAKKNRHLGKISSIEFSISKVASTGGTYPHMGQFVHLD